MKGGLALAGKFLNVSGAHPAGFQLHEDFARFQNRIGYFRNPDPFRFI